MDRLTLERLRDRYGGELLDATGEGWTYRPPVSDDPSEWDGVLRFAFVDQAYRYVCDLLAEFGDADSYCPHHETKPADRLAFPALCLVCWFDDFGYDASLASARWICGR